VTTRLLVKAAATGLVLTFGYLQLSGAEYGSIVSDVSADATFKLALALYYASWVAGTLVDTAVQERTYSSPPTGGRMPVGGFVAALVLSIAFGGLCFWAANPTRFAGLLGVFLVLNIVGWRYLLHRLDPTVRESRAAFDRSYFKLERLHIVYDEYLAGPWQVSRFAVALLGVAALNVLVRAGADDILIAGVTLAYVVVIEAWIWYMRLHVRAAVRLLDVLDTWYWMRRRPARSGATIVRA
jgi:hypothetical protein